MFSILKKYFNKARTERKISYVEDILSDYNITKYKINDDFSVDVFQNVIIENRYIGVLPIKFRNVYGHFGISKCGILTLKNFPDKITKNFMCINNNLYCLEHLPEVEQKIILQNNNLKSLKGSPNSTNSNFNIAFNFLESLRYAPSEVAGTFDCSDNKLTSLEYMPLEIANNFYCTNNPDLKELNSISNIEGIIICSHNTNTKSFDGYSKGIARNNLAHKIKLEHITYL